MTHIATIDFETYSEAGYRFNPAVGRFIPLQKGKPGLKGINAAVYAEHPSTRVISLAYDIGTGIRLWTPGGKDPMDLWYYILKGGLIEAHNSSFEYYIWKYVCAERMGWPVLPLRLLRCSSSKAKAAGLPGALGQLTKVLKPAEGKDTRGTQLIRLLSIPKRPTKTDSGLYRSVEKYPGLYREMYEYNMQDVRSEESISAIMPELSPFELRVWQLDQKINTSGVYIDQKGLADCLEIFRQAETKYTAEIVFLTNGTVQTVGEITKRSAGDKWLISQGVDLPSLDKPTIKDALEYRDWTGTLKCKRLLKIRQIIGGANVKKLFAMARTVSADGRLRDLFVYCGAERTGRWAGRGPQPQNLKNSGPNCIKCLACRQIRGHTGMCVCECTEGDALEWGDTTTKAALETIATRSLEAVESQWGNAIAIISSCLRSLFIASPKHDLICSDYSAIEAVVLAALAGEEWRLEVFRTHGKIYEASAAMAYGVPLQKILDHKTKTGKHHALRKKGKVRELANGYSGWINASKVFGHPGTDDEIKTDILQWRSDSPMIVELWGGQWRKEPGRWKFTSELYGLEGAVVSALLYPGQCFSYREITYGHDTEADILYCLLPSGRRLSYHEPRLTRGVDQRKLEIWQINFMGWNSDSLRGPIGWIGMQTYGGRLCENCCQAVARDILAAAMLRIDKAGYPIVLHVHDEIISEVPKDFGSVEEFEQLMMIKEPWFADWPIKAAGGWRGERYRK